MFHFVGTGLKHRFRHGLGAAFVGALCGLSAVSIIDGVFDLRPADSVLLHDVVLVIIGAVPMGALAFSARSAPPALLPTSCVMLVYQQRNRCGFVRRPLFTNITARETRPEAGPGRMP